MLLCNVSSDETSAQMFFNKIWFEREILTISFKIHVIVDIDATFVVNITVQVEKGVSLNKNITIYY